MLKNHKPATKLGVVLRFFAGRSASDAKTIPTIVRKLYPASAVMRPAEFEVFINDLSLDELVEKLNLERNGWREDVKSDLRGRYPDDPTHQKAYPRCIKRLAEFAEQAELIAPGSKELLPEWQAFIDVAETLMPATKADLVKLAAAGMTTFLDRYQIDHGQLDKTAVKIRAMRYALKRLARTASAEGLTPRDFAEEVVAAGDAEQIGKFASQTIYQSYCRHLWNAVIQASPPLDLPLWEDRRTFVSIPYTAWPTPLQAGLTAALFERTGAKPLAQATFKHYRNTLGSMLGLLQSAGLDLYAVVSDLSPKEAVRLLACGWPRTLLTEIPEQDAPVAIYRRLLTDPEFRREVLAAMRAQEGVAAGAHLVENPFVTVMMQERLSEQKYASAHAMLDRVFTINAEYLAMQEGNRKWITARLDQVAALEKDHETGYDVRKQVVFKHPRLFEALMKRQRELFDGLDERFKAKGPLWATHVRDFTYLALVSMYPLRVRNHQLMKLGENYDPETHRIEFDGKLVKNGRRIEFELPSEGALSWVRDLVDLYLAEARPILLRGAESDYMFVGNHQAPNAKGFLTRQAFNECLIDLSEKYLRTVVPAELGHLNPHIFRHIMATYQIVIQKNEDLAAQFLNDEVETVRKHYADILANSRGTCKAFLESFGQDI